MSSATASPRFPRFAGVSARDALAAHAQRTMRGASTVASGFGSLVVRPVDPAIAALVSVRAPRDYDVEAWRVAPGGRVVRPMVSCVDGEPGLAYTSGAGGLHRFRSEHAVQSVQLETALLDHRADAPCVVGTTTTVTWAPTDRLGEAALGGGFLHVRGLWWCAADGLLYVVERRNNVDVVWGLDPAHRTATALYVPPHDFALVRPSEICASDTAGAGVLLVEQPGAARTTTVRLLGVDGRVSTVAELRGPSRPAVVRFDPSEGQLIVSFPSVGLVVRVCGSLVTGEERHDAVLARAAVHGRALAV